MTISAPTLAQMQAAHERLAAYVVRTPAVELKGSTLNDAIQGRVTLKLELLQRTGTFKFRGALNNLLNTPLDGRGITAVSAGNHAVAVACAARALGVDARIVMQSSANPARRAAARAYGADLLFRDTGQLAFAAAHELVEKEGRVLIHPFDGPWVAQATGGIGLELLADAPDLDAVVVSVGGGGLAGGLAAAIKAIKPACRVYGVEPEGARCMTASFAAGHAVNNVPVNTIADSLGPPMTTDYTYALCRAHLDDLVVVSDDAIVRAVAALFEAAHLAVEPAGATALAGVLGPLRDRLQGCHVGIIVCGTCIDAESYCQLLKRGSD